MILLSVTYPSWSHGAKEMTFFLLLLLLHDNETNSPLSPQHMCSSSCESKALANDWLRYFIIEGSSLSSWSKRHSVHKCQGKCSGCCFCCLFKASGFNLHLSDIEEQCDIFSNRISVPTVTEGEHTSFCVLAIHNFVRRKLKHMKFIKLYVIKYGENQNT